MYGFRNKTLQVTIIQMNNPTHLRLPTPIQNAQSSSREDQAQVWGSGSERAGTSGVRHCAAGVPSGGRTTGASLIRGRYRSESAEGPQGTTPGGAQAVRGRWEGGQVPGHLGHGRGGLFPRSSWEGRQNCGDLTASEHWSCQAKEFTLTCSVLDVLSGQLSG